MRRATAKYVMLNNSRSFLITLCVILACNTHLSFAQAGPEAIDTLNVVDATGKKQGWWKIIAPIPEKPGYSEGALVEEGRYTNSKRTGIWRRYWPNGKPLSEITYQMGRPKGDYKTFYPSGKVEEQGTWDLDRNTGRFLRYHPNGKLAQDFIFNEYGTRDGEQKYYHENGQLAVQVNVNEGKEDGVMRRYTATGELQQVAEFNGGLINAANSRYIKPVPKAEEVKPDISAPIAPEVTEKETTNTITFRPDGFNTLYDEQMRISQQGEYAHGRLYNGRRYMYDANGMLVKIKV
ncbi:MAG: toxin-antitoxin system YwqK family antitoxin, partial [Bacteroidota bacterium]|nr:toxin-antitoxin system YwqK family antitoxin [Bacteroidota bacterium]